MLTAVMLIAAAGMRANAQDARKLTVDEAVQMSIQNSKQLRISKAKVDEATATLHEARDNKLPDVKASGAYLRIDNPNVDLKVKLGSSSTTTGEPQKSSTIKVDQALYGIVNVSLPLFSGLRIHYGIESAKYLEKAAQLDADNDRQAVIENTINAYSNLYKAKKSVELVNENLSRSKQRVSDFSSMEQNGLMARNDLLKAQLESSNIELSLLDAENNYKIASINMALMLGMPENTEIMPDSASLEQMQDSKNITDWEQGALQNRKDIQALNYRHKAANAHIRSIKGEYYPGIALTGGYIAADIPNLLTITNAINGGIGLQYNIGSLWKTGAKVAQARAREQQIEANEAMLDDQVRIQISQAYQNYLLNQKKTEVYNKAVEQANENYKITKNKYDNSLVTTTDLLDADLAQLQAKLNYEYSKADAFVAYKRLLQTAGMLN
ncbi:MAG: TolC family protein [Taibaiella sp.]|nr:TolC family protein [Taibaiella sp.]